MIQTNFEYNFFTLVKGLKNNPLNLEERDENGFPTIYKGAFPPHLLQHTTPEEVFPNVLDFFNKIRIPLNLVDKKGKGFLSKIIELCAQRSLATHKIINDLQAKHPYCFSLSDYTQYGLDVYAELSTFPAPPNSTQFQVDQFKKTLAFIKKLTQPLIFSRVQISDQSIIDQLENTFFKITKQPNQQNLTMVGNTQPYPEEVEKLLKKQNVIVSLNRFCLELLGFHNTTPTIYSPRIRELKKIIKNLLDQQDKDSANQELFKEKMNELKKLSVQHKTITLGLAPLPTDRLLSASEMYSLRDVFPTNIIKLNSPCTPIKVSSTIVKQIGLIHNSILSRTTSFGGPAAGDQSSIDLFHDDLAMKLKYYLHLARKPNGQLDKYSAIAHLKTLVKLSRVCPGGWAGELQQLCTTLSQGTEELTLPGIAKKALTEHRVGLINNWLFKINQRKLQELKDESARLRRNQNSHFFLEQALTGNEVHGHNQFLKAHGEELGIPGAKTIVENLGPFTGEAGRVTLLAGKNEVQRNYNYSSIFEVVSKLVNQNSEKAANWMRENFSKGWKEEEFQKPINQALSNTEIYAILESPREIQVTLEIWRTQKAEQIYELINNTVTNTENEYSFPLDKEILTPQIITAIENFDNLSAQKGTTSSGKSTPEVRNAFTQEIRALIAPFVDKEKTTSFGWEVYDESLTKIRPSMIHRLIEHLGIVEEKPIPEAFREDMIQVKKALKDIIDRASK